ncbi:MAG: succinate dehydrogenase, cytochrome b556 subunit [Dehalococcoidales bacterium]
MKSRTEFIYRGQVWSAAGMWAWLLHRITGFYLLFYILQFHAILVITLILRGEEAFNAMLGMLMGHPVFKVLNVLLLAALYYHGLNGIRLLLHDMGIGVNVNTTQKAFRICLFVSAGLWVSTVSFIL